MYKFTVSTLSFWLIVSLWFEVCFWASCIIAFGLLALLRWTSCIIAVGWTSCAFAFGLLALLLLGILLLFSLRGDT